LLGALLLSGCCCCRFGCCRGPCCFDGFLDGFQFLERFVAGINGGFAMSIEVFFGTLQFRFGPSQRRDGRTKAAAGAAPESWRRPWTHSWRRRLPNGRGTGRSVVLGAQTIGGQRHGANEGNDNEKEHVLFHIVIVLVLINGKMGK
jgi:hypothetical protein